MAKETLFQLTLELARELNKGGLFEGDVDASPAPTATTIDDAAITLASPVLDNGTIWIRTGAHAGKSRIITDHTPATKITFDTLGSAPAAGDLYTAFGSDFKQFELRSAINKALKDIPDYGKWNETLVTVAQQEDYTLPAGVGDVAQVWIASLLSGPDLLFFLHSGWIETQDGKLRFLKDAPALASYKIRIGYNARHSELTADADTIDSGIKATRLVYEAAAHAWKDYMSPREGKRVDERAEDWYTRVVQRAAGQQTHDVKKIRKTILLAGVASEQTAGRGWPYGQ